MKVAPTPAAFESSPLLRNRMLILGMGYVGQFLGTDLKNKGWVVTGTCTTTKKHKQLSHLGFDAHVFHANQPEVEVLDILKHHTHLLISIPPVVGVGDPILQNREDLQNELRGGDLRWLGYLSSTSVYGDSGGSWLDEDYPVNPGNESGKARVTAEREWLKFGHDLQIAAQVFRLGGIYGPGRSAIDTIIRQEPLSKKQKIRSFKQYTSRIHVSDICQALNASIDRPFQGGTYNLVDDNPAPRSEVFEFAQSLVRKKWPGLKEQMAIVEEADLVAVEGPRAEKRVSNTRMKKELGVRLIHPSYISGLQSIIDQIDEPFAK
ncbi:epimerase/racemase [Lithospermum erythrorhizon]|uniref:Epimerase/racemase n=1 Tax=Lithospermum erythrorhizon TaxID=34254 RepID=A0AAV3RD89_LITER